MRSLNRWHLLAVLVLGSQCSSAAEVTVVEFSSRMGFQRGSYKPEDGSEKCFTGTYEFRLGPDSTLSFYAGDNALAREIGGEAFVETDKEGCQYVSESVVEEKKIIFTNRHTCGEQEKSSARRTLEFQKDLILISQVVVVGGKTITSSCRMVRFEEQLIKPGPLLPIGEGAGVPSESPTVVIEEEF